MKKNSEIHLKLETNLFEKIKKQAQEEGISISELCRKRLKENSPITKVETMIAEINTMLKNLIGRQEFN